MKTPNKPPADTEAARPLPGGGTSDRPVPEMIPAQDREMVTRGLEEARSGDLATDEEVRATFARFRV